MCERTRRSRTQRSHLSHRIYYQSTRGALSISFMLLMRAKFIFSFRSVLRSLARAAEYESTFSSAYKKFRSACENQIIAHFARYTQTVLVRWKEKQRNGEEMKKRRRRRDARQLYSFHLHRATFTHRKHETNLPRVSTEDLGLEWNKKQERLKQNLLVAIVEIGRVAVTPRYVSLWKKKEIYTA